MTKPDVNVATQKRAAIPALIGLLLTLAGPVAWILLMEHTWLWRTGLPAWVTMGAGLLIVLWAMRRDRRWRVRLPALASIGFSLLFVYGFYGEAALPAADAFEELVVAPDFELRDHTKHTVSLADSLDEGRVLLVFYRGHW